MPHDVIDRETLDGLVASTDMAFVKELIDAYLEDSPELISALQESLAAGKGVEFTRAAHTLKSSSASVGAAGLSALAKELELMAKESNLGGAGPKVEQLAGLYQRTQAALMAFRNGS